MISFEHGLAVMLFIWKQKCTSINNILFTFYKYLEGVIYVTQTHGVISVSEIMVWVNQTSAGLLKLCDLGFATFRSPCSDSLF